MLISTGAGEEGEAWCESEGGLAVKHTVVQAGAFEFIVRAIQEAQAPSRPQIHRAAYSLISTLCFGHDGKEGFGDPALASARRERAVAAGVLEALAIALKHDRLVGVADVGGKFAASSLHTL